MHVGGFFSDLATDFDCVKYEILLGTLHSHCIQRLNKE
jgi:hypothetical protein